MASDVNPEIPPEVRMFISRNMDSVELIKVLLLLHKNPERAWTIDELTAELRSSHEAIEKRLNDLYDRKVLRKGPDLSRHRYLPWDNMVQRTVDALSKYEQEFPYRVIDAIYARRENSILEFAKAFSFKKDKGK